jgi:alpha-tubulin suppressor-like RCC1 family protein
MDPDNPQQAIFSPVTLGGALEGKYVVDVAAGEEHTVAVAQLRKDNKPISEYVYACGNNLKGQLGINRTSHLQDFTLVEDISELYD